MGKTIAIFGTIIIFLVVGGAYLLTSGKPQISGANTEQAQATVEDENSQDYEYYWGDGCPHCAVVDEFFDSWENYDRANITKYETWKNPSNAARMKSRANECGIPANEVGVPLLYAPEGKCVIGDQPIIDLFQNLSFNDEQIQE